MSPSLPEGDATQPRCAALKAGRQPLYQVVPGGQGEPRWA